MNRITVSNIAITIALLIITAILGIFIIFCFTTPTVSQERGNKKISIQQARSPEFMTCKVTNIIYHPEYTADSSNIKLVIDSLYIIDKK